MKMFRITCFVTDKTLHDVLTQLEDYSARNVDVQLVRNSDKPNKRKLGVPKGEPSNILTRLARGKGWVGIQTLRDSKDFSMKWLGALVRHGYISHREGDKYILTNTKKKTKKRSVPKPKLTEERKAA